MVAPWLFVTALFCGQALAGNVPVASNIGLSMRTQNDGWIRATSDAQLDAEVYVSKGGGYIKVNQLDGDIRYNDAEILLSIWEAKTNKDAGDLKYIEYINIDDQTTANILDSIWREASIDLDNDNSISLKTEYNPRRSRSNWRWTSLMSSPLGTVGSQIANNFDETQGFYISSFAFGRNGGYNRKWLRINFKK
ncbi:hypothetical protein BROUX41_006307 [Berkeleyomyces rouxiae]